MSTLRLERLTRYTIDGQTFTTVKAAREHVDNEAAAILQSMLRIHDGRHSKAIAAIESVLTDPARRARLAALLTAEFDLDHDEE